jgi:hypothetical protein
MVIVKQFVECELVGETEVLGGNLLQHHFVHHKFHMNCPGLEPGQQRVPWDLRRYFTVSDPRLLFSSPPRQFNSSYTALNRTTAGKRPLYCCANGVTCVANRCGATKYKHSLLLARLTSAFFGFRRLSSALFGSLRHGTVETRFLHSVTRHNIYVT